MARDEPNRKSHVIPGARSNLTTSEMVRSGHCVSDNTEEGPSQTPSSHKASCLLAPHPAFLRARTVDHLPQKHCKYSFPGPPSTWAGSSSRTYILNKLPGEYEARSCLSTGECGHEHTF